MSDLTREIRKEIMAWYELIPGSSVLYCGEQDDPVAELLRERGLRVECMTKGQLLKATEEAAESVKGCYDLAVSVAYPERLEHPEELFAALKCCLKPEGRLLLGMNNRMGIRYFIGDRDPHTNRNYDGVEGYRRAYSKPQDPFMGRSYNEAELKEMLLAAGFQKLCFFSVLSDLSDATVLFREDYLPAEDLATRITPRYEFPETVFLEEEGLYGQLIRNGLFHKMANAYFIECFDTGEPADVLQATLSMSRGKENALVTLLHADQTVEKKALYPEGEERLTQIVTHLRELRKRGIATIDLKQDGASLHMPLEAAEIGQQHLRRMLETDTELFLKEMDHFRDLILQSSEHVREDQGDGEGVLLKKGYIDMVPLNTFFKDGEFVFFDQEFAVENYPANAIISRLVCTFYDRNIELQKYYPKEKLLERYGLLKDQNRWYKMDTDFFRDILARDELQEERRMHRTDSTIIGANRVRINFTSDQYQKYFVDIFEGLEEKKLLLFGSGAYAKKFLELYSADCQAEGILDNQEEKWGKTLEGIPILNPEILSGMDPDTYKVMVCIKNYAPVMRQLESLGVKHYCVYDANRNYPRKRKPILAESGNQLSSGEKKKYHIGYVAGVFDLFHMGHLNLLKRAKEQCDYLIVGIVSDAGVTRDKDTKTFIPFEERKAIVAACRYVDEVVEVPPNYSTVRETFRLYHYDVQFSGNDHENDPVWLEEKAYLNRHGADIVFFPYTESTSSTKLKDLIQKKLL